VQRTARVRLAGLRIPFELLSSDSISSPRILVSFLSKLVLRQEPMRWRKKISIRPNYVGYVYKKNKLIEQLNPGIYTFFDINAEIDVITLPTIHDIYPVTNQEVLTKDNIALRFSYIVEYQIVDGELFLSKVDAFNRYANVLAQAQQIIHNLSQVYLRETISTIESETLNERRHDILNEIPRTLSDKLNEYGILIHQIMLRDVSFPKSIQELFAKQLEAKIRAKADLENARTAVATARALKNASDLIKDDDNIKFFQFLETLTKIASKGNHTFVLGDMSQNGYKK
jgi:regulator of protease activity HflC (stomatin/prohibitin superfamily)